jgi:hypothetical protein
LEERLSLVIPGYGDAVVGHRDGQSRYALLARNRLVSVSRRGFVIMIVRIHQSDSMTTQIEVVEWRYPVALHSTW